MKKKKIICLYLAAPFLFFAVPIGFVVEALRAGFYYGQLWMLHNGDIPPELRNDEASKRQTEKTQ